MLLEFLWTPILGLSLNDGSSFPWERMGVASLSVSVVVVAPMCWLKKFAIESCTPSSKSEKQATE